MTGPMIPRQRSDYSAIVDRPPLKLPGGARMIVWTIVNLEVWDISKPMARQVLPAPTGVPLLPDVPNWSWHEYGMRVGVWRFFDLYKKLGIAPTLSINARVCEDYPRVAQQAKDAGWEFMGHAYEQGPIHKEADQKAMIARSMGVIEKFTGKRPVGWLGPGLTQTLETPENLAEAGVKYIGDWVYDDEPTVIRTEKGPLVTLPYTVELNDIPMMLVQHHDSDHLLRRSIDSFDRLYAESKDRPKIMSIAIHPYISGQPFRIKYLEQIYDYVNKHEGVVHWNGEQMLKWYQGAEGMNVHALLPTVAATEAAVAGGGFFPVRRIYCVGRNYLDHIREMKEADERDPPFFFQKPRDAIVLDGARVPYPPFTSDFQFEVELVVALGRGGRDIAVETATSLIWGYAVGIDFTRRDRQRDARDLRLPWEVGKSFDASAPCGPIAQVRDPAHFEHCAITLAVNGIERQRGDIGQMIWSIPEVIAQLSKQVTLEAGDLIYTGTPAGVGAVVPGDLITAHIDGLPSLTITITPPEA